MVVEHHRKSPHLLQLLVWALGPGKPYLCGGEKERGFIAALFCTFLHPQSTLGHSGDRVHAGHSPTNLTIASSCYAEPAPPTHFQIDVGIRFHGSGIPCIGAYWYYQEYIALASSLMLMQISLYLAVTSLHWIVQGAWSLRKGVW